MANGYGSTMRPIKDNVLVKQDAKENKVGSLFVPQGNEHYPNFGTVLAIGSKVVDVKVGDRVLFKRKPASALNPDSRESAEYVDLLMLPEDHILAIVD